MKYTIIPGIAALVHVECEAFPERYGRRRSDFVFLAEGKLPVAGVTDPIKWGDLPLKVQAEINKHFGTVFAMPIEARGKYMDEVQPWDVEVNDEQG